MFISDFHPSSRPTSNFGAKVRKALDGLSSRYMVAPNADVASYVELGRLGRG